MHNGISVMSGVLGPDLVLWANYKISWLYTCTGHMYCRLYNIHSSLRDGAPLLVGRQILLMLIILACLKFVAHLVHLVHIVHMLHMVQPNVCGHQLLNSVVQYAEQRPGVFEKWFFCRTRLATTAE